MRTLVGEAVDELRLGLGVDDFLTGIDAKIPGKNVCQGADRCKIRKSRRAEQLDAKYNGSKRAVDRTAEHSHKAECCGKTGWNTKDGAHGTSKGCSYEKSRNDFAAFISKADGNSGKNYLEKEGPGIALALFNGGGDDIHPKAAVIKGAKCKGHGDNQNSAQNYPYIYVLYLSRNITCGMHTLTKENAHKSGSSRQNADFEEHQRLQSRRQNEEFSRF